MKTTRFTTLNDWKAAKAFNTNEALETSNELTISNLFSRLFTMRQMAHDYHLKPELGNHLALGDYYDGILDLIDELFETYQGQYGLIEGYKTTIDYVVDENIAESLNSYLVIFNNDRNSLISKEDTHLHNICDEIVALTYRTLFKLKYLSTELAKQNYNTNND